MALTSWAGNYLSTTSMPLTAYPLLLSAWGYRVSTTANRTMLQIGTSGSGDPNRYGQLRLVSGNQVSAATLGTGFVAAQTTTIAGADTWFHAAASFSATNARDAYINGGDKSPDVTASDATTPDIVYAGHNAPGENWGSGDALGELSIWNTSGFSSTNRDDLVTKLAGGDNPIAIKLEVGQPWTDMLVAYWRLTDTNDLNDLSGNGHHMTMQGTLTNWGGTQPPVDQAPTGALPLVNGLFVIPIVRPV